MNILAVEAHPDDIEFMCAGTLARLAALGHSISVLSISAGENGSMTLGPEEMIRRRHAEGIAAAAVLNGDFYLTDVRDKHIFFEKRPRDLATEIFRRVKPDVVFALSPQDYILDHEFASMIARDAATAASAPNFRTGDADPAPLMKTIPHLYYCAPIHLVDVFGDPVYSSTYVDISSTIDTKEKMLACHASQREWMKIRFGMDNYVETMRHWAQQTGEQCGMEYAEGFRQHLAPPFPSDNLLVNLLGAKYLPINARRDEK